MLINILIAFFIYLIGYQLFLGYSIREGIENCSEVDISDKAYKTSLENSADIKVLKEKADELDKKTVGLPERLDSLQNDMNQLSQSVAEMGNSLPGVGGTATADEEEDVEEDVVA